MNQRAQELHLDNDARGALTRQRDEQEPRQLVAEHLLQALERGSPSGGVPGEGGAVLEQQLVAALAPRKREITHGFLAIGAAPPPADP
jgi:hypothetical protein